jgi:hypothetical protein
MLSGEYFKLIQKTHNTIYSKGQILLAQTHKETSGVITHLHLMASNKSWTASGGGTPAWLESADLNCVIATGYYNLNAGSSRTAKLVITSVTSGSTTPLFKYRIRRKL